MYMKSVDITPLVMLLQGGLLYLYNSLQVNVLMSDTEKCMDCSGKIYMPLDHKWLM